MKKRISCKVIKTITHCESSAKKERAHFINLAAKLSILNHIVNSTSGNMIYSKKLNISNIQNDNFLTDESLDFYA